MCDPFFEDCSAPVEEPAMEMVPVEEPVMEEATMPEEYKMPRWKGTVTPGGAMTEDVYGEEGPLYVLFGFGPGGGQSAYAATAFVAALTAGLRAFRWRDSDTYYNAATVKVGTTEKFTNYWKIADPLMNYASLAIWGVLTITQLLSRRQGGELNLIAWKVVMPVILGLVNLIYSILMFLGFNSNHTECVLRDTAQPSDFATNPLSTAGVAWTTLQVTAQPYCDARDAYRKAWEWTMTEQASIMASLLEAYASWLMGQVAGLNPVEEGADEESALVEEDAIEETTEEEVEEETFIL